MPLTLPVATGLNVTLIVQPAADASAAPQLSVSAKLALAVILAMFNVDVP